MARNFAEDLVFGLIQAAVFLVPCVIGYVAAGGWGLLAGVGVGLVLLGILNVLLIVFGLKGARDLRRQVKADR